jgi:hypothetical protein
VSGIPHPEAVRAGVECRPGCLIATDGVWLRQRASRRGVRAGDLLRLVEVTGGVCMVCRVCHAAVVEHCHFTLRVRGLVCRQCNHRISLLEGEPEGRTVLYRNSCWCLSPNTGYWRAVHAGLVPPTSDPPRARDEAVIDAFLAGWNRGARDLALQQATYAFLDHAQDAPMRDRKDAFSWLADNPYPTPPDRWQPLDCLEPYQ